MHTASHLILWQKCVNKVRNSLVPGFHLPIITFIKVLFVIFCLLRTQNFADSEICFNSIHTLSLDKILSQRSPANMVTSSVMPHLVPITGRK